MIKKVFNFLDRDISGLHRAAYVLGFSAFLSQLLALLRDRILAHSFGASESLDIYYAAFRVPDFIFITVASIVSVSVLIPILAKEEDIEKSKRAMNEIFSVFFFAILCISVLTFFLIPKINPFIFSGFSSDVLEQLNVLSRIMLLSPIFLGLSNFFTSIIQSQKKFFVYALSPLLYNIGIIIGILFFYPRWSLPGLALGVVFGAFLHLLIQLPSIYRLGFIPNFTTTLHLKKLKKIFLLSLPRTLAVSSSSLAILVLISLATHMREGSIAVFNFAYAMQSIPLTIVGVSYTTAAFPFLSKISKDAKNDFMRHVGITAKYILFWTISAMTLLFVLRAQIVRTVLGSGEFSWVDTRLTAACLALFSISIPAQSLILFFVRGYYAAGKTRRPVLINILSSSLIVVFVFFFSFLFKTFPALLNLLASFLKVSDISDVKVLILPLSFSIASILNMILLYIFIQRDFRYLSKDVSKTVYQVIGASFIMALVTYFSLKFWDNIFDLSTLMGVFMQGLLAGLGGIMAWLIVLISLGNSEILSILIFIKNKIKT